MWPSKHTGAPWPLVIVVHRYAREYIKLADFGVAHISKGSDNTLCKTAGTPAFMAPESLSAESTKFEGKPVDLWAMGVTLYCLLYGTTPFEGNTPMQLYTQIRTLPPALDTAVTPPLSPAVLHTLTRLLDKDPSSRMTIAQLRNDPWMTRGGTDPVTPSAEVNCTTTADGTRSSTLNNLGSEANIHDGTGMRDGKKMRRSTLTSSRAHSDPGFGYSSDDDSSLDSELLLKAELTHSSHHSSHLWRTQAPSPLSVSVRNVPKSPMTADVAGNWHGDTDLNLSGDADADISTAEPKAFYLTRLNEHGVETMIAEEAAIGSKDAVSIDALRRPANAFRYQRTCFTPPSALRKKLSDQRPRHTKIQKIIAKRKMVGSIV